MSVREVLVELETVEACTALSDLYTSCGGAGVTPGKLLRGVHRYASGAPDDLVCALMSSIEVLRGFAEERVAMGNADAAAALDSFNTTLAGGPVYNRLRSIVYKAELLAAADLSSSSEQISLLESVLHPSALQGATPSAISAAADLHRIGISDPSLSLEALLGECKKGMGLEAFHDSLLQIVRGVLKVGGEVVEALHPLQSALRTMRVRLQGVAGRVEGVDMPLCYLGRRAREVGVLRNVAPRWQVCYGSERIVEMVAEAPCEARGPSPAFPRSLRAAKRKRAAEHPPFRPVLPKRSQASFAFDAALGLTGMQCSVMEGALCGGGGGGV